MAKLILSLDGAQLREFPLTKERTTIGRKAHNDVVIDNLAVSGEHAMIMTILNDSFLEDLGSTNGTLVNGQSIKKHFLQDNDVIELGKYKLRFVADVATTQQSQHDFEKTMVLRSPVAPSRGGAPSPTGKAGAERVQIDAAQVRSGPPAGHAGQEAAVLPAAEAAAEPAGKGESAGVAIIAPAAAAPAPVASIPVAPAPAPVAPGAPCGMVQILSGANAGRELQLTKALTTLGRPGVQVAVIAKRPLGFFITHVEGDMFPSVNGKQLDAQAHRLEDHDIIELSGIKMEFFIKPAA